MAISGSFNYSHTTQRENDFRSKTLSSGYTGVTYLSLTVSYSWSSPSGSVSQTVQIRDPNGNSVASGSGSGTSGTFTVTATSLNPSLSYSIWGSASSFLGQTFAIVQAFGTISYFGTNSPSITSFTASPNPQLSSDGTPSYSTILNWSASDATSYTINGSSVSGTALNINDLPQSEAGVNSPAQTDYTLVASNVAGSVSSTITVDVYNDNTPSSSSVDSNAVSLGTPSGSYPLTELENAVLYRSKISFTGTDMPVIVTSSDGYDVSADGSTWGGTRLIEVDQTEFYIRYNSLPYNTSTTPTGTNAAGEAIGSTNTKTINYTIGSVDYSFDVTTRAPVLEETFDATGDSSYFPFPDIDIVPPEPTTDNYIFSDETLLDDIEVDVEIKTNRPDAQVQINNDGVWRDMREI